MFSSPFRVVRESNLLDIQNTFWLRQNPRRSVMPAQRCHTDQETRSWSFQHMYLSALNPLLDRASIHVTEKRRLSQRYHAALGFTLRAPRHNRTYKSSGDHNLICFNGDPGSPLAHVASPFQALPATFGVVDFRRRFVARDTDLAASLRQLARFGPGSR
jgi:hypothetical protein